MATVNKTTEWGWLSRRTLFYNS